MYLIFLYTFSSAILCHSCINMLQLKYCIRRTSWLFNHQINMIQSITFYIFVYTYNVKFKSYSQYNCTTIDQTFVCFPKNYFSTEIFSKKWYFVFHDGRTDRLIVLFNWCHKTWPLINICHFNFIIIVCKQPSAIFPKKENFSPETFRWKKGKEILEQTRNKTPPKH